MGHDPIITENHLNELRKTWDNEPFAMPVLTLARRYLEETSPELLPYRPFPPASDRAAYEALPAELRAEVIREGETCLGYDYPAIRATDYMRFKRTGNRTAYEEVYFARRGALCSLAAAECVEHQGRFLDDIVNGIFAVCEESGWQLPPHNSYLRSEPQHLLPDAARPVLDLFACETGALLACVEYALGAELDAFEPCITRRIRCELRQRILTPYLTGHFWWMGGGTEEMCNWTAWCTQNVLLTAFLSDCGEGQRQAVLAQAAASCDYFLKDYGEDGCCDEGPQYFRHAGLCLGASLELMNAVTGGAFAELFCNDKIRNLGMYIVNLHAAGKYYFNFADCSAVAGRCSVREYLFGKQMHLPVLCAFAAGDYVAGGCRLFTDEVDACSLFHRLQTCFAWEEIRQYAKNSACKASASAPLPDVYYESVGIFIARDTSRTNHVSFCLAVKAGDNADGHNHNDTGSLILYKNGLPLLADIGVETYTQKTFSAQRYEIRAMQSGYHNLPTIGGQDQRDGWDFRATEVSVSLGTDTPRICMELATAYPLDGVSYRRSVTLDRARHCVVVEDVTNSEDVILNFITYEKPQIKEQSSTPAAPLLLAVGTLGTLAAEHCSLLAVETIPVTDPRLRQAWEHNLYRIRLRMEKSPARITLA